MSLILEALRKSESERQMGQPPGLMSPAAPSSVQQEAPKWLFWASCLIAVALVGGGAWWMGRSSQDASPQVADHAATTPADAVAAIDSVDHDKAPPAPEVASSPPTAAAPAGGEPPAGQMVLISKAPTPAPAPAPAEPAAPVTPAQTLAPQPAATANVSAAASTPVTAEPIARPPDINLMPSAQRSALPPLKLSVHVFHEQVDRRFAIIDGRRMLQGSQLNPQITIEAIERDGVWLSINGSSWWLPR